MKPWLFLILLSIGTFSCNVLKVVDRKQEKRFSKEEMPLVQFRDGRVIRSVHVRNTGRPKIMLLHGYGASGIGQYYRTALDLNADYDLILPDLLYCGKSRGDESEESYTIAAQVEHLKIMLDSLNVHEPMLVIGNSYGGIVASYFAEKYPEWVNKLVIYDSPVNEYRLSYADSLAHRMEVPSVLELLSPTNIHENRKSLDIVFYDQPYIPRFLRRQMVKYGSVPARPSQLKLLEHLIQHETAYNEHFFQWKMPVYVCWGQYDELIPMQTCRAVMKRYQIPEHRLHVFPHTAHAANVEYPEAFIEYVRSLMNEMAIGK
ncbi:MAG: alpha/beta hydrolase [Flavobacteriales bacterium]|nr:alpha/beta hydrolase [Flavobacteriales bacterium]